MKDFNIEIFNFDDINHVSLLNKFINSPGSDWVSKNVLNYVKKNIELNSIDHISNVYIVKNNNDKIGIAFLNYHPEKIEDDIKLKEEIEIGLGLLPEFRGKHLGSLFEKEFSEYLLGIYPQFNEIVVRLDENNISSKRAVEIAGFVHIQDDEYHYKRK